MSFPRTLVGCSHLGGFLCEEWELRVTERCLSEDLGRSEANFDDVATIDIVHALRRERADKAIGAREITPLTRGLQVWRLAHGEMRGGTWHDEQHRVIWLVGAKRHRSGATTDAYPYIKDLDRADRLAPSEADYKRLRSDRAKRIALAVAIDAPLLLRAARRTRGPLQAVIGGRHGLEVELEVNHDGTEFTTIVFRPGAPSAQAMRVIQIVLAAFHGGSDWESTLTTPSRDVAQDEVAFLHLHETEMSVETDPADDGWARQTLISIRDAFDQHNAADCPVPARAIHLHPTEYARLGFSSLWGLPVISDENARERYVRVACEGSAHRIEEEISQYLDRT